MDKFYADSYTSDSSNDEKKLKKIRNTYMLPIKNL